MNGLFTLDGQEVPFSSKQTIIAAARVAGIYIPHLCHHPDYAPHGSCKLCTVSVNGRFCSACTHPAEAGAEVLSTTDELTEYRRRIIQMLFVEGNHYCPFCEKSGNCRLQATAYYLNMLDNHYPQFFPKRQLDASHPDLIIDHDRCIFCTLCERASQHTDQKNIFAISGRGIHKKLIINSASGLLCDTGISVDDAAIDVCPTGAIMRKQTAYQTPIGQRQFDQQTIAEHDLNQAGENNGEKN